MIEKKAWVWIVLLGLVVVSAGGLNLAKRDIYFHTDISRDFLLLDDMVENKNLTLLGPRSGGIAGLFHGPLWLYVNLPVYFIFRNPGAIGIFWVGLYLLSLGIIYLVTKAIFDKNCAVPAAILLAVSTAKLVPNMFNPYGALMLFPLFFWISLNYLRSKKSRWLLMSFVVLGLIIQFQMAFGVPILMAWLVRVGVSMLKEKRWGQWWTVAGLALPLSTFLAFDLRHDWLQTRSFINYLTNRQAGGNSFGWILQDRLWGMGESLGLMDASLGRWWIVLAAGILIWILKRLTAEDKKERDVYGLFIFLFAGYWLITLLYRGKVWDYYYFPFWPVVCMIMARGMVRLKSGTFRAAYLIILLVGLGLMGDRLARVNDFAGKDLLSWQFHKKAAARVFEDAPSEFGYFVFTPDQYGYPPKYAMNLVGRDFEEKRALLGSKQEIVYLMETPKYDDNPYVDFDYWKLNQVKIDKEPLEVMEFENGYRIEKYQLDQSERLIEPDPNLINSLILR